MGGRVAMLVLLLTSVVAVAQPTVPEGTRLFEEGRELAKQGKYDAACEKFKQSLEIDRAPGTSLNYGDCLEQMGQLRKAFQMYDEAARLFERDQDARAKFARERASAVLPKLGTIIVKLAEPTATGLVVEIGRQSVPPQGEIIERFEPGDVAITARVPGLDPFTASARVLAGATVIIEVPAFTAAAVIEPPPRPLAFVRGERNRKRVYLGLGLGIGGAAALGLSAIVGLQANSSYDTAAESASCMREAGKLVCTAEAAQDIEDARSRADIGTGLAVVGAALVTTGIIVYVTAPRETLTVAPMASATTAGVTLSGRF
ncbi:MAG: tetratricopeptide repeat protein [Deltaproteobacteria bacterium]|nr:tetratricopeptide repeat protein [Deltaproteobacteria bacterium]